MTDAAPPPLPPPPPPPPGFAPPPFLEASTPKPGGWAAFWVGILVTVGLIAGIVAAWPADDPPAAAGPSAAHTPTTLGGTFAVPEIELPEGVEVPDCVRDALESGRVPDCSPEDLAEIGIDPEAASLDLFAGGAQEAVAQVLDQAADPTQLYEIAVYPTYLFVAYRDPLSPERIDRRQWRAGQVGRADANPIDDEVGADTEPGLFTVADVDLGRLPDLLADTVAAYTEQGVAVEVTHVLIDRFLPFDERVLVRVYASPAGSPSGGGYVSYTVDGTRVGVCC